MPDYVWFKHFVLWPHIKVFRDYSPLCVEGSLLVRFSEIISGSTDWWWVGLVLSKNNTLCIINVNHIPGMHIMPKCAVCQKSRGTDRERNFKSVEFYKTPGKWCFRLGQAPASKHQNSQSNLHVNTNISEAETHKTLL